MDGEKLLNGIREVREKVQSERHDIYLMRMTEEAWHAIVKYLEPMHRHPIDVSQRKLYGIPVSISQSIETRHNNEDAVIEILSRDLEGVYALPITDNPGDRPHHPGGV